jgi:hypothetical protein
MTMPTPSNKKKGVSKKSVGLRGVEILKCSTYPRASYLKKVTCPDNILLVLFFV